MTSTRSRASLRYMAGLAQAGHRVVCYGPGDFWRAWNELEPDAQRSSRFQNLRRRRVTLGFLGRSHLGDVLCTSPLVRWLSTQRQCQVRVVRHRSTCAVFRHNPYLSGYQNEGPLGLTDCAVGSGHIIQKLQRHFGTPLDPFPRPEIYLSAEEIRWAWHVRSSLPLDKPVALVCTNAITDGRNGRLDHWPWQEWSDLMAQFYSVVQLALTDVRKLEELVCLPPERRRTWRPDRLLDRCACLKNLSPRQFFAAFSVADFYLGPNTGAAHLAAAFDLPAVVAVSRSQYQAIRFPDRPEGGRWRHESFLYPYHAFLWV